MNFEVNNGSRVLFWYDVWCGDRPYKDQFPDLFRMAHFKDVTVQQLTSWNGDQILFYFLISNQMNYINETPRGDAHIQKGQVQKSSRPQALIHNFINKI